jgi:hypothetical protein
MPRTLGVVPPDHPMFSIGPSFVFKSDLPPEITPADDDDAVRPQSSGDTPSTTEQLPAEEEQPSSD